MTAGTAEHQSPSWTGWVLGLVLIAGTGSASAGAFNVNPVRVHLTGERPVEALSVSNKSREKITIQVETRRWEQSGGEDRLSDTRAILANPPLFTIPPGGKQTVRVGTRDIPEGGKEKSFRLLFREVPPEIEQPGTALNVALEINMPVFVSREGNTAPDLRWQADIRGNRLILSARNEGNGHARITGLAVKPDSGSRSLRKDKLTYILPGNRRSWSFNITEAEWRGVPLAIRYQLDDRETRSASVAP